MATSASVSQKSCESTTHCRYSCSNRCAAVSEAGSRFASSPAKLAKLADLARRWRRDSSPASCRRIRDGPPARQNTGSALKRASMKASTNAGHSAATCTALAGAVASAGFSAGSREQPVSSAATIRLVAANTRWCAFSISSKVWLRRIVSVCECSRPRGLARRHGFEATKRVVETARVEEQVAERKLSAARLPSSSTALRSAVNAPTRSPIAASAMPSACQASGSFAANFGGIVMPTSYDARRALRGWLPGNHCTRGRGNAWVADRTWE